MFYVLRAVYKDPVRFIPDPKGHKRLDPHTVFHKLSFVGTSDKSQLGLSHSYSRCKVKFNVNKSDNMIIQEHSEISFIYFGRRSLTSSAIIKRKFVCQKNTNIAEQFSSPLEKF